MKRLPTLLSKLTETEEPEGVAEQVVKKQEFKGVNYVIRKHGDKFFGVAPEEQLKSGPHDDPEAAEDAIRDKIEKMPEPAKVSEQLTKQHFVGIADVIKTHKSKEDIIHGLADYFAGENPRFDKDRFVKAAGGTPGKGESDSGSVEEQETHSFGQTPEETIREKLPHSYKMDLVRSDILSVLRAAKESKDQSLIDKITGEIGGGEVDDFLADPDEMIGPGKTLLYLDKDVMIPLLKALGDSSDDNAMALRSDILTTIGIEEV